MMSQSDFLREMFRDELDKFDFYLKEALKNDNPRISDIVRHVFKAEGKRVRPILVFLAAKACGKVTEGTYHGAVTVELLHTATLVHDDVVDESPTRRGQPSAHAVFDNKRAVLAGDYLLSSSLRESVKTGSFEVVDIMSELGQNLAEGELNQYGLANEIVIDEKEYFEVIEKKTACLLHACTRIGAITSGADRQTVDKLGEMGRLLGICFQIRDDIFDYFKADIGKPTGNDIREGKITLPLIYSLRNAPQAPADEMMAIIRKRDYSPENIGRLLDFAKQNGGIDYACKIMDDLLTKAHRIARDVFSNNDLMSLMDIFIAFLRDRKY